MDIAGELLVAELSGTSWAFVARDVVSSVSVLRVGRAMARPQRVAAVAVSALLTGVCLTAGAQPTGAAAVEPCGNLVTALNL